MASIITMLVAYAPALVKLALWLLDKQGASAADKKAFLDLVFQSEDDALTPIEMKDQFEALRKKLKDQKAQPPAPTTPSKP
jgi:hypothetical protein